MTRGAVALGPAHHSLRDGDGWPPGFVAWHAAPVLLLTVLATLATWLHADFWLADRLYALQGQHWLLRWSPIAEQLIHVVGRDLSTAAWLCVLAAWAVARSRAGLVHWRRPLATLLVSTLLATALVAWIKSWSNMDCPWDLTRYGGSRDYISLLAVRPTGMPRAACFPAGHASAGYAWMALYFFFLPYSRAGSGGLLATRPSWRWLGLGFGIALGLLFGVTQQLRGAHFLSHDLWTAAICWAVALGVALLMAPPLRGGATATSGDRVEVVVADAAPARCATLST